MIKDYIYVTLKVEGIHRWAECPYEEVSYLKEYHRHIFHIKATLEVKHTNRDVEFIMLQHQINKYLTTQYFSTAHQCLFFDNKSCEMIANELLKMFGLTECEVSEDGENGAIVKEIPYPIFP